ncbi:MAG: hypothetical protein Kow0029_24260 [Candidatus Rifleibacteriota bacterium]
MNHYKIYIIMFVLSALAISIPGNCSMEDMKIICSETQTVKDSDGEVSVKVDWLARPGEMAVTITYYGYLTQEGMVNMYLNVNGQERDFVTLKQELKNRAQRIRYLSFHPVINQKGKNILAPLSADTVVDSLLFRNAPYYQQFGDLVVELKFFCNGRWDGDGNNHNENYRFVFTSRIKDFPMDHF